MYRTAIMKVNTVIKMQIDQFAPATVPTTFQELMEICDTVSGQSQCSKKPHDQKVAI